MTRKQLRLLSAFIGIWLFFGRVGLGYAATVDEVNVDLGPLIDEAVRHPNRFAVDVPHAVTSATQGEWSSNGTSRTWTYIVKIPTSVSLSFHAKDFSLPPSAILTVAGLKSTATYTARDAIDGGLWGRPLAGDTLIFTLVVDAAEASSVRFGIASFQAGYRGLGGDVGDNSYFKKKSLAATSVATCTENYVCNATPANQGSAHATVAIIIANIGQCTGTLLNNTSGDGTPYVLTARHCEDGALGGGAPNAAASVIVYWDAVTPCGTTLGSIYDGSKVAQSGASTVVEQQDMWLLKLNAPPLATDAFYAGWDATGATFVGGYSIHHALGLDKQYTSWFGPSISQHLSGSVLKIGYASDFWGVVNDRGNVGAGASGGAVFDSNDRVVGSGSLAQLTNGEGSSGVCPISAPSAPTTDTITALYTSFGAVWNSISDATSTTGSVTLKSVLDPGNTGQNVLDGFEVMPIQLSASTLSPTTDQSLTLSWSAPGADSCVASGGINGDGWSGTKTASGSMQVNEYAGGEVVYSIRCTAGNRIGRASVRTTWTYIAPVVILNGPSQTLMVDAPFELNWGSTVSPCVASGGNSGDNWAGTKATSGFQTVAATRLGQTTYTLTCGSGGRIATVHVNVTTVVPAVTLSADATQLRVGSIVTLHWTSPGYSSTGCATTGGGPGDFWPQPIEQSGNSIIITESVVGTYTYTVTCNGGGLSASSSVTVDWTNSPAAISLNAVSPQQEIYDPNIISPATINLLWTSNVSPCSISSIGPLGNTSVNIQGSYPSGTASAIETIAGHYTYILQCGGLLQTSTTIDWVTSHPKINLTSTTKTWAANVPYTISWNSNAVPCNASGGGASDGWAGSNKGVVGTQQITETAPGNYTFFLTCGTGISMSTAQLTVTVPPPGVTISASPQTLYVGQVATLTWNSSVSPCRSDDGSGINWGGSQLYVNGSMPIFQNSPGTYVYPITCGTGGQTVHATTQVVFSLAPATTVSASTTNVQVNTPVTLNWSSPGATSCNAYGGNGNDGWSGTLGNSGSRVVTSLSSGTLTYGVTCNNNTGGGVQVTYTGAPSASTGAPIPAVTLSASQSIRTVGESVTLSWNAANASQCVASGGNSGDGWTGSLALTGSMNISESSAGAFTYRLTCTGAPPAGIAQTTVTFSAAASGSNNVGSGGGGGGGAVDHTLLPLVFLLLLARYVARRHQRYRWSTKDTIYGEPLCLVSRRDGETVKW